MKKKQHIRTRSDFQLVFKTGRRMDAPLFLCLARRNALPYSRFGLMVSRAVHKRAVVRNTVRRRAREWLRGHQGDFPAAVDLVLVFKKPAAVTPRRILYEELAHITRFIRRVFAPR